VMLMDVSWINGTFKLNVNISTTAFNQPYSAHSNCLNPEKLNNITCSSQSIATADRYLQTSNTTSFKQMWSAIATRIVVNGTNAGHHTYPYTTADAAVATQQVQLSPNSSMSVITALADTLAIQPPQAPTDPTADAVKWAISTTPAMVTAAAQTFWSHYYNQSAVFLPDTADVEAFWWGAQYYMAIMSPSDSTLTRRPLAPPSGLYGPWVTEDNPGWNGDFTLDYNQESQFFGAWTSNRIGTGRFLEGVVLNLILQPLALPHSRRLLSSYFRLDSSSTTWCCCSSCKSQHYL